MEQEKLKLEGNITQALLVGLIVGNLSYIIRDIIVPDYSLLTWSSLLLVLLSLFSIYLIRVRHLFRWVYFPCLLLVHLIHVCIFFYLNGFNSTLVLDFINIGFVIMFAGEGWSRRILASVFIISLVGLLIYQVSGSALSDYYNDNVALDTLIHLGISLYLAYAIKKGYAAFKNEVEQVNRELNQTNEELQSANEEISTLNEQLEEEVQRKSSEAHERRLRLIHYASKNAHEVRAPLVRIMGVMEILRLQMPEDPAQLEHLIHIIDDNTKEMDSILRDVSRVLEEQDG